MLSECAKAQWDNEHELFRTRISSNSSRLVPRVCCNAKLDIEAVARIGVVILRLPSRVRDIRNTRRDLADLLAKEFINTEHIKTLIKVVCQTGY